MPTTWAELLPDPAAGHTVVLSAASRVSNCTLAPEVSVSVNLQCVAGWLSGSEKLPGPLIVIVLPLTLVDKSTVCSGGVGFGGGSPSLGCGACVSTV